MKTGYVLRHLRRFLWGGEAVSALEYAILVGVIAIGVGAAIALFQDNITAAIAAIGPSVTTASTVTGAAQINP